MRIERRLRSEPCPTCEASRQAGLVRCRDCGRPLGFEAWDEALTAGDPVRCPMCGREDQTQAALADLAVLLKKSERASHLLTAFVGGLVLVLIVLAVLMGQR